MATNEEFEKRRDDSVARAIAYSATFTAKHADNAEVWDVAGKRYIDFCGGIGCQNIGHRHEKVVEAIKAQLDDLTHTCFQVSPYESYIALAERLNVPEADVIQMNERLSAPDWSLNATVGDEDFGEFLELLVEHGPGPEDQVAEADQMAKRRALLSEAISGLSDRERHILRERKLAEDRLVKCAY